jgi:hypothetical protein
MQNKLEAKYLGRLATFETRFPGAFRFLRRIETEGKEHGLWLSTATNAHLYKGDAFLAYVKLDSPELKPPALLLSPNYNVLIHADATDHSHLLFPRVITKLVMDHKGFSARWAVQKNQAAVELSSGAPDRLFDALFETLRGLDVPAPKGA